jgi:iron complex outermembrane receptor protein
VNLSLNSLRLSQRQKNFSQEFNVSGPSDGKLTWLVGAYYYNALASLPYFNTYAGDAPNAPIVTSIRSTVRAKSYAAFGDLTYNVTDQLHLTVGARYTSESKRYRFRDIIRTAGLRTSDDKTTWESPTFRGVVRYDFARDFNVYASVSNGFKSGVYNAYALPAVPVRPEKIRAVEVGAKARLGGVTFTAAAFDYKYKDIQVQGQTLIGQVFVISLANAARAKIRGFEVTADGRLTDNLSFNLGVSGLPTAKYTSFTQAQVFIPNAAGGATNTVPFDASGSRIIRAPKWKVNAGLTYQQELFGGEIVGTVNYSYNDGFYWQPANLTPESSYSIVNARLAWTEPEGRITYSVWAENLTNEIYSMYTPSGTGGYVDAYAAPRQIGVGIAAKF